MCSDRGAAAPCVRDEHGFGDAARTDHARAAPERTTTPGLGQGHWTAQKRQEREPNAAAPVMCPWPPADLTRPRVHLAAPQ